MNRANYAIYVLTFSYILNLKPVKKGWKVTYNFRLRLENSMSSLEKRLEKNMAKKAGIWQKRLEFKILDE